MILQLQKKNVPPNMCIILFRHLLGKKKDEVGEEKPLR